MHSPSAATALPYSKNLHQELLFGILVMRNNANHRTDTMSSRISKILCHLALSIVGQASSKRIRYLLFIIYYYSILSIMY